MSHSRLAASIDQGDVATVGSGKPMDSPGTTPATGRYQPDTRMTVFPGLARLWSGMAPRRLERRGRARPASAQP